MEQQSIIKRLRDQLALTLSEYYRTEGKRHVGEEPPFLQKWRSVIDLYDIVMGNKDRIIGVYGTPKMGKPTLLNSLVQEDILPRGIKPVTGSVINMERQRNAREYTVTSYRADASGKEVLNRVFRHPDVEKVHQYLEREAGQSNPSDRVEVRGSFPRSLASFRDQYKLRDTPGAISRAALSENLSRDSQRAIQSMNEVCVPLFCVSSESLQEKNHVQYFKDFFADRICICVITKCDDVSEEERLELRNEFLNAYGILDADIPIVFTAKSNVNDPFVMQSCCHELEAVIGKILSEKHVSGLICSSCQTLLDLSERGVDIGWDVPSSILDNMKYLLREK